MESDKERYEKLKKQAIENDHEISQIIGKLLGYPWYKDDQKNFPGATEENGVCVGEHVAVTLVMEIIDKYKKLEEELTSIEGLLDAHDEILEVLLSKEDIRDRIRILCDHHVDLIKTWKQ